MSALQVLINTIGYKGLHKYLSNFLLDNCWHRLVLAVMRIRSGGVPLNETCGTREKRVHDFNSVQNLSSL
jgi:hypothetical protein